METETELCLQLDYFIMCKYLLDSHPAEHDGDLQFDKLRSFLDKSVLRLQTVNHRFLL